MARIKSDYPFISEMSGVFERKHKGETAIVVTERYGNTYANKVTYSDKAPSTEQLKNQARFATASTQAAADMADPDKRAEWQEVADNSNGRYKTARGAAMASYYADAEQ